MKTAPIREALEVEMEPIEALRCQHGKRRPDPSRPRSLSRTYELLDDALQRLAPMGAFDVVTEELEELGQERRYRVTWHPPEEFSIPSAAQVAERIRSFHERRDLL